MKLECPHCFQRYEISKKDQRSSFHCVNCEQTFLGSHANIVKESRDFMKIGLPIILLAILLILIAIIIFLFRLEGRIDKLEAKNCIVSAFQSSI